MVVTHVLMELSLGIYTDESHEHSVVISFVLSDELIRSHFMGVDVNIFSNGCKSGSKTH